MGHEQINTAFDLLYAGKYDAAEADRMKCPPICFRIWRAFCFETSPQLWIKTDFACTYMTENNYWIYINLL